MQLNSKSWCQLVLSVAGVCSLSLPFTQTAQAKQVRNFCGKYESTFVAAETTNFWVSICGGDLPHTYIGVDKKTGKTVKLPLNEKAKKNDFEAVNGEYTYIVNYSVRGKNLTVLKGNRQILREAIVRGL